MKAELNIRSNSLHTCGIITGFHLLAESGKIELAVNDLRNHATMPDAVIDATVNDKKLVFDLSDGYRYDNKPQIEKYFSDVDMIFKRSFSKEKNRELGSEIADLSTLSAVGCVVLCAICIFIVCAFTEKLRIFLFNFLRINSVISSCIKALFEKIRTKSKFFQKKY